MKLHTEKIEIKNIGKVRFLYYPHKSYLTSIKILTHVGSEAENDTNQGMAHILEHMFFKGSKSRPGGTSISRAANDIGAKMNAYTTYDHTAYYITVLNDEFSNGFDILADMYLNPLFPAEEFAKEINPILSELREQNDNPESFLMEKAFAKYFGASYHPIIGTEQSIKSATVDGMHVFKDNFYGGENCLISIVGGVSKDEALNAVEKFFSPLDNEGNSLKNKLTPKTPKSEGGNLELEKEGINEAYCHFLYPALSNDDPDRYKQDMMSYLLGGNDSSLLFERIREELGMSCYGIYSWTMRNKPYNTLGISCGIAPEEMDQLENEVNKQIKIICDAQLTEDRIKRTKASLISSIASRVETSAGLNSMIALSILRGEQENPIEKLLSQIEKTNGNDILEIAQRTFSGPGLKAVLVPVPG